MDFGFDIRNLVEVVKDGAAYDLHNDYDLDSIHYDVGNALALFRWRPANSSANASIELAFQGLSVFSANLSHFDKSHEELTILESFGFLFPEEGEYIGRFVEFNDRSPEHHLVVVFEGGYFRLFSRSVLLNLV